MVVRIVKCSHEISWYKEKIGETVEVEQIKGEKVLYKVANPVGDTGYWVSKCDVEIIQKDKIMTIKQFLKLLSTYPPNMPVKLLPLQTNDLKEMVDFSEENMLVSSEGAYIDSDADPDTWDTEDGKIVHKGRKFLLINPIIT